VANADKKKGKNFRAIIQKKKIMEKKGEKKIQRGKPNWKRGSKVNSISKKIPASDRGGEKRRKLQAKRGQPRENVDFTHGGRCDLEGKRRETASVRGRTRAKPKEGSVERRDNSLPRKGTAHSWEKKGSWGVLVLKEENGTGPGP